MSLALERIIKGVASLIFFGAVIYFIFFVKDKNLFIMEFMLIMGAGSADIDNPEFSAVNGLIRLVLNFSLIALLPLMFIYAVKWFLFAKNGLKKDDESGVEEKSVNSNSAQQ